MSGGLLGLVLVLGPHVYVHVLEDGAAEAILREHAADGVLHEALRHAVANLLGGAAVLAAGVTGEPDVLLVLPLVARELHLLGVDHDHVVATIGVRREVHLVLAAQEAGNFAAQAAEALPFGIHQQPLLVSVLLVDGDGLVAQRIHCASS